MPRYTPEQIYAFARQAGFSPDEAATMTAVALAESGGNSGAHNPRGEDSRGLWQINVNAHPHYAEVDLFNPAKNATAAFDVSRGGADISPWTTTHGGLSARYLRYRAQAEAAAESYGDGPGHGMWTGSTGYGDQTPATPAGQGQPGQLAASSGSDAVVVSNSAVTDETAAPGRAGEQYGIALESLAPLESPNALAGTPDAAAGSDGTGRTGRVGAEYGLALEAPSAEAQPAPAVVPAAQPPENVAKLQSFLDAALAQTGDQYVFGAETRLDDPNPSRFDCSELVEWSAHQAGVEIPDGAWAQYTTLHKDGAAISVKDAIDTPGALLFSFSSDPLTGKPMAAHVAISLGNGKTIEAMGTQYGVGSWKATPGRFQYAAFIPGLADPGAPPQPPPEPLPPPPEAFDQRLETDPAQLDSQPAAVQVSEQLTAAAPVEAPPALDPSQVGEEPNELDVGSDVSVDGVDDALAHATELAAEPDLTPDGDLDDDPATTA